VLADERIIEREVPRKQVANVIEAVAVSTGMVDYDRQSQEFDLFHKPSVILEQMALKPQEREQIDSSE